MKYLMIKPNFQIKNDNPSFFIKLLTKVVSIITPVANPDYEKNIDNVEHWLLEFENEESCPIREIGLDSNDKVILKMPYKKNYGFWTDNNMKYPDFKNHFEHNIISMDYFIEKWNEL